MPITIGSISKKAGCATRKGLIDCFLSNEHRASKTWTKIENFLYILLKRAKATTTKAKIEEEGRLL